MVATSSMSPRTPTASPTIGIGYDHAIAYNSHIQYNQNTTAGSAAVRTVDSAKASARTKSTATISPR